MKGNKRYKDPVKQITIPMDVCHKLEKHLSKTKDRKFKYIQYGEVVEAGINNKKNESKQSNS